MARPKSIDDEEILDAARDVFLEDGIQGTTAEIAERAGISEGTIYRRFSTKHELFIAAMDIPHPPEWFETLDAVDCDDDLPESLEQISLEIIGFFEQIIPKLNMVMCNLGEEQFMAGEQKAPPLRGIKTVAGFFERERNRGRIRGCDPEIVARMFLGSLFHFAFSEVADINKMLPMPRETYVRGLVTSLLDGIRVPPGRADGSSG